MLKAMSDDGLDLLTPGEIVSAGREELERRCRARTTAVNIGDGVILCRLLGRYKLYVEADDVGFGAHMIMEGFWESWLTLFMARRIKPGMRIVDAGANFGYYTLLFGELIGPEGRLAAIEPNPNTARLLQRSIDVNGLSDRVKVFKTALTDTDGVELIFNSPENEPKNARIVGENYLGLPGTITVTGTRLSTLVADWPVVDFIKMDVEGAEEAALAGGWDIVERDRPDLMLEFNVHRCVDPEGLLRKLEALYGRPSEIYYTSELTPISDADLLDRTRYVDWQLFYSVR